jgi:dienelactone hydrolase
LPSASKYLLNALRTKPEETHHERRIPADIRCHRTDKSRAALAAANKPAEFKIYPGAPHGFHADYRASYRKEAAEDGWNQMQAWFKKYKVLG